MSTALESVSAGVCRSSTHLLFLSRDDQRSLRILALSILALSNTELELFMLTAEILQIKWMKYAQDLYQFTGKVLCPGPRGDGLKICGIGVARSTYRISRASALSRTDLT